MSDAKTEDESESEDSYGQFYTAQALLAAGADLHDATKFVIQVSGQGWLGCQLDGASVTLPPLFLLPEIRSC
jgi:hypothetical protein